MLIFALRLFFSAVFAKRMRDEISGLCLFSLAIVLLVARGCVLRVLSFCVLGCVLREGM